MFASEKERQLELTRLKRDQRRAQQEEKFESAALLIGLSKEHGRVVIDIGQYQYTFKLKID